MSDKEDLHIGAHEGDGREIISGDDLAKKLFTGLDIFAEVGIRLGKSMDEQTIEIKKRNDMLQRNSPTDYQVTANGAFPAAGSLLLNLGSPDQGTFWEVSSMVIGGTDLNVAAVGKAGVYIVGTTMQTGGITNVADYAPTLPNVGFYGNHQMIVNDGEFLLVSVFGGTVAQIYAALASVTVFNTAAAGGRIVTTS